MYTIILYSFNIIVVRCKKNTKSRILITFCHGIEKMRKKICYNYLSRVTFMLSGKEMRKKDMTIDSTLYYTFALGKFCPLWVFLRFLKKIVS